MIREILKTVASRIGLFETLRDAEALLRARWGTIHDPDYRELPQDLDGGLLVDVGANIGQSVVSLHRLFPSSPIIAFEPNPRCMATLNRVATVVGGQVQIHGVGIGDRAGELHFYVPVTRHGVELLQEDSFDPEVFNEPVTLRRIGRKFDLKRITVTVQRLDDYDLVPKLVKIDVQGFEMHVLRGATRTIQRARPVLLIERGASTDAAITEMLCGMGYQRHQLHTNVLFLP